MSNTEVPNEYAIGFDTEAAVMETGEHWRHPSGSARVNLQFRLATPHQVDEAFARVIDAGAGVRPAPRDAFWGQRFARVTDPGANVVSLFADLPGQDSRKRLADPENGKFPVWVTSSREGKPPTPRRIAEGWQVKSPLA